MPTTNVSHDTIMANVCSLRWQAPEGMNGTTGVKSSKPYWQEATRRKAARRSSKAFQRSGRRNKYSESPKRQHLIRKRYGSELHSEELHGGAPPRTHADDKKILASGVEQGHQGEAAERARKQRPSLFPSTGDTDVRGFRRVRASTRHGSCDRSVQREDTHFAHSTRVVSLHLSNCCPRNMTLRLLVHHRVVHRIVHRVSGCSRQLGGCCRGSAVV